MTTVDKLLVEVRADIKDLKSNMNNAVRVTKKSTQKINEQSKILAAGFARVRIAAMAATVGIMLMGKSTLTQVDKIQKLGVRLGESTENLSRFKFVAEQNGISFETMAMAFQRMQRRVAEAAKGTGEAKDALKELGLNAENLNKLTVTEQFQRVTEAMEEVENTSDRTRLSMKLFDSEGVALAQIMDKGAVAMRNLARETPNVITQKDADRIVEFNDNLNILKANIQKHVIPLLSSMAKTSNKIFKKIDDSKLKGARLELELINARLKEIQKGSSKGQSLWDKLTGRSTKEEESELINKKQKLEEFLSIQEKLNKAKELDASKGSKSGKGGLAKKGVSTAHQIEEAMINSTNNWSNTLTNAILQGQNMFEGLAKTVQHSFLQGLVVDPLISGIQGGIKSNFSKAKTPTAKPAGAMSMSIINNFNPNVTSTVRAEIANAAPLIQQSAIAGMQQRQYNGQA